MCKIARRSFLGSHAAMIGGGLVGAASAHAAQSGTKPAPHTHTAVTSLMTQSANRWLAALDPEQKAKATFPFDADERMSYHYVPLDRKGLPLREMAPHQKLLACALLSSGLSQTGYLKALTIMSLDEVLRVMENGTGPRRDPEGYFFTIFGTPSDDGVWGFRVEGHHVSQNYTVVNGVAVDAPSFFGANPAEVRQGARSGLRTLAREDDLGLEAIQACDEEQRKTAIVAARAYNDILTADHRTAALAGQPNGLSAAKMGNKQYDALRALMEEYASNVPGEMAAARIARIDQAGRNIWFAWAGETQKNRPHYYRVQSASFLIEMDDTQDGANHIHSVWRDVNGDFGADLLKQHYDSSHSAK